MISRAWGPALRARLFGGLALLTVVAVNAAGLWSISASRRNAADESQRLFRAGTEVRARAIETLLSGLRGELRFLADSPPIQRLALGPLRSAGAAGPGFRSDAESSLLLFLRAHPELTRLAVLGPGGQTVLVAGRRGGIPILWLSSRPTGEEGAAVSPDSPRLVASVEAVEGEVSPSLLLQAREAAEAQPGGAAPACRLFDATGRPLARLGSLPEQRRLEAVVEVAAEGWSLPAPWRLVCAQEESGAAAMLEPVAARYRTTLALNLGAMVLAMTLGLLAFSEVRRRERLEAQAREETRVRELERQLFHSERLASVGRLAAGIAHEINNPLEGIANYVGLTRDALERRDLPAAARRLDGVRQGLERAALVVRQVLAQADPASAPKSPVDLNRVLSDASEFVRTRPEFAGVRFETALAQDGLVVEGSSIMLGQVALNLIVNACEAQPRGGEVRIATRREAEAAVAEVADRGPGIPASERERIFEPFFSTKNSTGLGLSICDGIVRRHGGRLEALARDGGGSVFRMTLPIPSAAGRVA